ncbi:MAG: bifunctional (p)ppGpp synthetase/guanosine-3',5'-bis(diphosphate) 3'-pyrophosphohydrolase [Lachnospiraceae bacterium]|nr:bifunctional (p)ppGpp synthetase/guanosine-3',5'-bis(diphosphate) 3'-pyrophosphohydrolase [Lachnospiraceae bacterium]
MFDEIPQKAIQFAAIAHKGATRKGNGLPYIIHPMETMSIVTGMTGNVEVMAAAALHDVIEDTQYAGRDIEERFGRQVAELVGMESEDKKRHRPAKDTWRERKEENLLRERRAPREAKMIMLSDKLSNVRSTLRDYELLGSRVWEKFNMKDPAEQEWYYRSVADVVEELADLQAYREYMQILDVIFQ